MKCFYFLRFILPSSGTKLTPTIIPTGRKSRDCVPMIQGVSKPKAKPLNSLAPNPDFTVC